MSTVDEARESLLDEFDRGAWPGKPRRSVVNARLDALIAAVRAERDGLADHPYEDNGRNAKCARCGERQEPLPAHIAAPESA